MERPWQFNGGLRAFNLFVNNKIYTHLFPGSRLEIDLEPGSHILQVSMWPYKSKKFLIKDNEENIIYLKAGFLYKNIFEGLNLTRCLKIIDLKNFDKDPFEKSTIYEVEKPKADWVPFLYGLLSGFILIFTAFHKGLLSDDFKGTAFILGIGLIIGSIWHIKHPFPFPFPFKKFAILKPILDGLSLLVFSLLIENTTYQLGVLAISICSGLIVLLSNKKTKKKMN